MLVHRSRALLSPLAFFLVLASSSLVFATEGLESTADELSDSVWFHFDSQAQGITDFVIDDMGTSSKQRGWLDSRVLAGTQIDQGSLSWNLSLEILSNQIVGQPTGVGTLRGDDTFARRVDGQAPKLSLIPQLAYLTWRTELGVLRVGHQSVNWGLGLITGSDQAGPDFGLIRSKNLVERVAFGTKPFSGSSSGPAWLKDSVAFLAGDLIYRDDNADLLRGDQAFGLSVGFKVDQPTWSAGILQSFRAQKDREDSDFPGGGRTEVSAMTTDAYVKLPLWVVNDSALLSIEAEGVVTLGSSTRSYLEETYADGAKLQTVGAVARLRYQLANQLDARLEAGYASGDNDPRDELYRVFSFHSDYTVGAILFDHVMPMLTARSVDRIHDPSLIDQAPPSTRFLVNQGTVRNARYLYPVLRWSPTESLEVRLAYLFAQSAGELIDPFQSGIQGGYNHGFDGSPSTSRDLGQEFTASVRFQFGSVEGISATVVTEGGALVPGEALSAVQSKPVSLARAGLNLRW